MENLSKADAGFSTFDDQFLCNFCGFVSVDRSGMKRHITVKHKNSGEKRSHDQTFDRDDKRPKIDEKFEPDLVSTQISDDELDEFDEVLKAEEKDFNEEFAHSFKISNESLALLGTTHFEFDDLELSENLVQEKRATDVKKNVLESVMQADLTLMNVRIKALENESKAKDLRIIELEEANRKHVLDLDVIKTELTKMENETKVKDESIAVGLSKVNTLEDQLDMKESKVQRLVNEEKEITKRINLLERALRKSLKKN